jgi:hypothetical protein
VFSNLFNFYTILFNHLTHTAIQFHNPLKRDYTKNSKQATVLSIQSFISFHFSKKCPYFIRQHIRTHLGTSTSASRDHYFHIHINWSNGPIRIGLMYDDCNGSLEFCISMPISFAKTSSTHKKSTVMYANIDIDHDF